MSLCSVIFIFIFFAVIPPLDFWLPCVAVRMIDRFLDGQRAYYTPCRISSRSCESVRLWRCEAPTYGAVVFITQPAFSIMRLQLNSDGSASKTSSVQKKGGSCTWVYNAERFYMWGSGSSNRSINMNVFIKSNWLHLAWTWSKIKWRENHCVYLACIQAPVLPQSLLE